MNISVAMATYNGELYIRDQIDSILEQLNKLDELVISDDFSTDSTFDILTEYAQKDCRIKIYRNKFGKGVVNNFQTAIYNCSNELIFFSDQDDVWLPNKVSKITQTFLEKPHIKLIISDITIVDQELQTIESSFFKFNKSRTGFINNLIKNSYIGCAMVINREYLMSLLPFPKQVPMHDWWIGICSELDGTSYFLNESLLLYRRHSETVTSLSSQYSVKQKLNFRINLILNIINFKCSKINKSDI